MKKMIFMAALIAGLFSLTPASAQIHVNVNINSQPAWGPSGYDYARYYFIPEINAYYDVASRLYVYQNGNSWIKRRALPARYKNFDLYGAYKVVLNGSNPWNKHSAYKRQYGKFINQHNKQTSLRDYRKNGGNKNGHDNGRKVGYEKNHQNNGMGNNGKGHENNGVGNNGKDHHDNGNGKSDKHDRK